MLIRGFQRERIFNESEREFSKSSHLVWTPSDALGDELLMLELILHNYTQPFYYLFFYFILFYSIVAVWLVN